MAKKRVGGCVIEVFPATKKFAASWLVTQGERQKDGIASTTAEARRDARQAAAKYFGCPLPRKRRS